MQAIALTCVANSHVISNTPGVITREVPNTFTVSLSDSDGAALDIAGITTWELGIARGFLGQSTLLAFTTDITAVGSVLTVTIDTATEEFSAFLAGKLTATIFATLRGYGVGGVSKAAYTFPMTAVNVGYDDTTADTNVLNGLTYTKGVIDARFADIADTVAEDPAFAALLTAKESVANKTQAIDAVTPSEDAYPSEAAVVAHVAGLIPDVPADLSDLSDDTGILAGKEPAANKATDFTTVDDTKFPTTRAVASYVDAIPAATESSRGTIALATAEEATSGTDQNKAVTPATLGAVLEDAIPVIPPIPADLSDLSDTTGILTAKESVANKTQAIDAVTPSADKYTSEAAVVAHVASAVTDAMGDIEAVLDELIGGTP